jgi:hypothetical protein
MRWRWISHHAFTCLKSGAVGPVLPDELAEWTQAIDDVAPAAAGRFDRSDELAEPAHEQAHVGADRNVGLLEDDGRCPGVNGR